MDYDELEVSSKSVPCLSEKTVVEYQKVFRDMIGSVMMDRGSKDYMVGGPGTTIEIDESQYGCYWLFVFVSNLFIGKRKYHRGSIGNRRRLWVLGGIVR